MASPRCVSAERPPCPEAAIHEARRIDTTHGDFFAKWSSVSPADIFIREAEGLKTLRGAESEIVVPRVIATALPMGDDPAFLILDFLEPAPDAAKGDDERLGRGLAEIHRSTAAQFGFSSVSYCGSTKQDNSHRHRWVDFFRDCRLSPILAALDRIGRLSIADRHVYETLLARLDDLIPNDVSPSLIHGDLWSGNVLESTRGPALVDPACAYADREMEFGITTLFGGMSPRAMAAYDETFPLREDWRDRNPLYQLYHLLNHALLFGGSYGDDARRIALRYVS